MLSQTQRNKIFTEIATAYTIDAVAFTALKTYRAHWRGELDTPVICLEYAKDGVKQISSVGRSSQYDSSDLVVDIYATTYNNAIHGSKITREIAVTLSGWFNTTDAFDTVGVSVSRTDPVTQLDDLEDGIYRMRFVVKLLHKAI